MEPPAGGDPETLKDAPADGVPRDRRRPTRPTTSAASTRATGPSTASLPTRRPRRTPRCGSRSRTGAGPVFRSSSARASACRSPRPSCGSCSRTSPRLGFGLRASRQRARSARDQARPVDRRPAHPRCPARRRADARPVALDMTFAEAAARARPPTRCCSHAAMAGQAPRFTRQDGVEERGACSAARSRRRRRSSRMRPAPGGPTRPTRSSPATAAGASPWTPDPHAAPGRPSQLPREVGHMKVDHRRWRRRRRVVRGAPAPARRAGRDRHGGARARTSRTRTAGCRTTSAGVIEHESDLLVADERLFREQLRGRLPDRLRGDRRSRRTTRPCSCATSRPAR